MGRGLAQTSIFVQDSIKKLGIEIHPGSRLWQMHQVLFDENKKPRFIPEDDPQFSVAKEALRDLLILENAFGNIENNNNITFLRIVKQLVSASDSVLSQDDLQNNSPSRDYQAELFVAALCSKARMIPVRHEEPDICCTLNGDEYGIAVKRIKSERQFVRRVKKAAGQIEKSKKQGVIVVDVTLATNPKNIDGNTTVTEDTFETYYHKFKYVYYEERHLDHNKSVPDNYLNEFYEYYLKYFYNQQEMQIKKGIQDKGVIGIILHFHIINKGADGSYELNTSTLAVPIDDFKFKDFKKAYINALPNLRTEDVDQTMSNN